MIAQLKTRFIYWLLKRILKPTSTFDRDIPQYFYTFYPPDRESQQVLHYKWGYVDIDLDNKQVQTLYEEAYDKELPHAITAAQGHVWYKGQARDVITGTNND